MGSSFIRGKPAYVPPAATRWRQSYRHELSGEQTGALYVAIYGFSGLYQSSGNSTLKSPRCELFLYVQPLQVNGVSSASVSDVVLIPSGHRKRYIKPRLQSASHRGAAESKRSLCSPAPTVFPPPLFVQVNPSCRLF